MRTLAVVAAAGARTALGQNLVETAFLLRTGAPAIAASPLVDGADEPVTMCFDPTLDPYLVGDDRAAELAAPALAEALAALGEDAGLLSTRLVLCVDGGEHARGAPSPGARLASLVHARARAIAPGIALEVVARGAAGAAFALGKALEAIAARQVDAVVLGGIHTDYDPATIAALDAVGRVFTPANLDALIPGEAAAFVVLMRDDVARRHRLAAPARIGGVGTGMEAARPDNDESALGAAGLTAAVRAAAADLAEDQLRAGWGFTDLTFENRRVLEWQAMIARTHALWGTPYHVESPAQRLGHLGAAALPLAIALAAEGWRRGYAPSAIAMAFAGSNSGERGAVLLYSNV